MSNHMSLAKCFEDAQESGFLYIAQRSLKELPPIDFEYDLADVTSVDISRNRFCELPEDILSFAMLEVLNSSRNFLKTLPDMSHMNSLTNLDISQNQFQTLPVFLCQLPLKIFKASHNRITSIPSEIGSLNNLQLLDLSCNELTTLPSTFGDLAALRTLNMHRNNIITLPDELSKLKYLQNLDFSSNKITSIPPAFRLIQSIINLKIKNNPLSSPPAKTCAMGRIHLAKSLGMAAQEEEKKWAMHTGTILDRSPSLSSVSSTSRNEITISEQETSSPVDSFSQTYKKENFSESDDLAKHNHIVSNPSFDKQDICEHSDMSVDNRNSSPIEEKPKFPSRPPSLAILPIQDTSEKYKLMNEKGKLTPQPHRIPVSTPSSVKTWSPSEDVEVSSTKSADRSSFYAQVSRYEKKPDDENIIDVAARKEQLLKKKEEILESKLCLESIKSKSSLSSPDQDVVFEGISKRSHLGKQRSSKKFMDGISNFTMRRFYDSAKEEFEELEKLRKAIEERLRIKLPDDLPGSLSDGIVLCHLINNLRKGTIVSIHVPSSGVPKLTMPKCQMNVDAFLDACRKVGVDKMDLCSPPDILEEKSPTNLCRTVQALLVALGNIASNTSSTLSQR